MKKMFFYMILPILMFAALLFTGDAFAKTALDDSQLDHITAGATVLTENRPVVVVGGDVRDEAFIDGSVHVGNVIIKDAHIDQRAILINLGNENQVLTGLNVQAVIGRSPSDSSNQGSAPNLSGLQSINQVNNIIVH